MRRVVFILISTVILHYPLSACPQSQKYPPYTNLVLEGIKATLNEEYLFAENRFKQVISSDSRNPAGYFLPTSILMR